MRLILNLVALSLLVGSFQSCVSQKKYNELLSAKEATDQALAETQAELQTLQDQNEELQATLEEERDRLNGEIEDLRSDLNRTQNQVADVQEQLDMTEDELNALKEEISGTFNAYSESGLELQEREGRLYVVTDENIHYGVGSARLSSAERSALDELANTMKENPNLRILVEGHTDNLQYPAGAGFNNWDLSVSRAMGVVKYLLRQGVNADQLAVAGYGESMPIAPNDSAEGRSENRRTVVRPDINMAPIMDEVMNNN